MVHNTETTRNNKHLFSNTIAATAVIAIAILIIILVIIVIVILIVIVIVIVIVIIIVIVIVIVIVISIIMSPLKKKAKKTNAKAYVSIVLSKSNALQKNETNHTTSNKRKTPVRKSTQSSFFVVPNQQKGVCTNYIRRTKLEHFVAQKNIIATINKAITNNFQQSTYSKRHDNTFRRSRRNLSIGGRSTNKNVIEDDHSNYMEHDVIGGDNPLWGKNRCFVEDFMVLQPHTDVVVLFPTTFDKVDNIMKAFDDIVDTRPSVFNFGQGTSNVGKTKNSNYYCINGSILTNPKCEEIQSGGIGDMKYGFSVGNYGANVVLQDEEGTECYQLLITWRNVLDGGTDGIQVWTKMDKWRDCRTNFANIHKNEDKQLQLLHCLFEELYGDTCQLLYLLTRYYMGVIRGKQNLINDKEKKYIEMERMSLQSQSFDMLGTNCISIVEKVDDVFKNAFHQCYSQFCAITESIVDSDQIDSLVHIYKSKAAEHYEMMKILLGFDKKENLSKRNHLKTSGYYDRLLLFNYLLQLRIRNPQNCTYWASIPTAALYGRGCGKVNVNIATGSFFGHSVSMTTFLRKTKTWRDTMSDELSKILTSKQKFTQ